jgi:hypothetical protein
MKSFYNIIKIATNATSGESVAVGLFVYSGNKYFVQFSDNKKKIAKMLMESGSELVDYLSKQITQKTEELNQILSDDKSRLFKTTSLINSNYFNYLNKYSNNVLQFSSSYIIIDKLEEGAFQKLFASLIDSSEILTTVKDNDQAIQFYDRINKNLIEPVKDKVHTNIRLNKMVIPSLYFNYEMDCLGMNGVFIGAKSIDFNSSNYNIDKEVSRYFQVSMLLAKNYQKDKKENNFYIIGDEPNSNSSKNHKIWESINKQKIFKIIHSEESNIIAYKIEETAAHTFLKL